MRLNSPLYLLNLLLFYGTAVEFYLNQIRQVTSLADNINQTRQLVAIQKAVNVLNTMRQQGIKQNAIPAFLKQAEYANPLTQKPFLWDDDRQQIIINESKKVKYYLSL